MPKNKIFIVAFIAMMLVGTVFGCGSNETASLPLTSNSPAATTSAPATTPAPSTTVPPATTPAPDAILKLVNSASASLNTFEGTMQTSMSMNIAGMDLKLDMTGTMTVDKPGKKLVTVITGSASGMGQSAPVSEQLYLINDTMYMKGNEQGSGLDPNTWYKQVLSGTDLSAMWTSQDVTGQIQILLDSAALQIIGTENINGVPCYKLKINPNLNSFMNYLSASGNDIADAGITNPAQAFKQLDVSIWVNQANYMPAKMDMAISIAVDSQAQSMNVTMTMSQTFNKVNQQVTITLPAAAQGAVTMPS